MLLSTNLFMLSLIVYVFWKKDTCTFLTDNFLIEVYIIHLDVLFQRSPIK